MPHFLAVYTMKREDLAKFRAMPKAEQYARHGHTRKKRPVTPGDDAFAAPKVAFLQEWSFVFEVLKRAPSQRGCGST